MISVNAILDGAIILIPAILLPALFLHHCLHYRRPIQSWTSIESPPVIAPESPDPLPALSAKSKTVEHPNFHAMGVRGLRRYCQENGIKQWSPHAGSKQALADFLVQWFESDARSLCR